MCARWKTSDYHRPVSPPASCDWRLSLIIGNEKRTSHFLTFLTGSMRNLGTFIKPRKVSPLCWVCPRFCSAMIPRSCMVFATVSGLPGRGRKRARSARSMMLAKKLWNLGASRQQVWQYNHVITIHLARMAAKVWNHRRLCLFWFFWQLTFSLVQANKILWLDLDHCFIDFQILNLLCATERPSRVDICILGNDAQGCIKASFAWKGKLVRSASTCHLLFTTIQKISQG